MLKSRSKGEIAMLQVQLAAANKNYLISLPSSQESYYDILIDIKNKIIRAQVKFCNRKRSKNKDNLELRLDSKKSKRIFYTKTMIDWILVFLPQKNVILKYEQEHFHKKKTITINLLDKQSKWFYGNYIWK